MIATIVSGGFKVVVLGLPLPASPLLLAMIARPLGAAGAGLGFRRRGRWIQRHARVDRFQARDGTELGFRHYPASAPATGQIAILVHGSSGSSGAVHALSKALAERGVETYAPDIRGHGESGIRGDIGYLGQLEDDIADFVAEIRKAMPPRR